MTTAVEHIPISPSQQYLLNLSDNVTAHFCNVSEMYAVDARIDRHVLDKAFAHVQKRHEVFRYRFGCDNGVWTQWEAGPDVIVPLDYYVLEDRPKDELSALIEAEAGRLQASLNLFTGPLVRLAVFDPGAGAPCRLLVIAHHLICDHWSLHIVVTELQETYRDLLRGYMPSVSRTAVRFEAWSRWLAESSRSPSLSRDLGYWMERRPPYVQLPADFALPDGSDINLNTDAWDAEAGGSARAHAEAFAKRYGLPLHIGVVGVLASVLAQQSTSGVLPIGIWNNGRCHETPFDLLSSVGFFARPVTAFVDVSHDWDLERIMQSARDGYTQCFDNALAFLRSCVAPAGTEAAQIHATIPRPAIVYNFLDKLEEIPPLRVAPEQSGGMQHDHFRQGCTIELYVFVKNDRLSFHWLYSKAAYRRETIVDIANRIIAVIEGH